METFNPVPLTKFNSNESKVGGELSSLVSDGNVGYIVKGAPDTSNAQLYQCTMDQTTSPVKYATSGWSVVTGTSPAPFLVYVSNIGEFQRIHAQQPFLNNSAQEYNFFVTSNGAEILNVINNNTGLAYVTYKKSFTPFDVTNNHADSAVVVPEEFFDYIAHSSYADFLRMDGQTDKAFAEEQRSQVYLDLELERIDIISNNNNINKRFSTYVNRQSR